MIQSVKAGLSESIIIRTIQRENKPANLTTADLVKLKNAGVSENIIEVMLDPGSCSRSLCCPRTRRGIPASAPSSRTRSGSGRSFSAPARRAYRCSSCRPRRSASLWTNSIIRLS